MAWVTDTEVASERDAVAAEMLTQVAEAWSKLCCPMQLVSLQGIRAWFYGEEPPGVAPGSRPKKLAPPGLVQYEYQAACCSRTLSLLGFIGGSLRQELEASTQKFAQRLGEDDAPVAPPLWLGSGGSSAVGSAGHLQFFSCGHRLHAQVYRGVLRGSDVAVKAKRGFDMVELTSNSADGPLAADANADALATLPCVAIPCSMYGSSKHRRAPVLFSGRGVELLCAAASIVRLIVEVLPCWTRRCFPLCGVLPIQDGC